MTTSYVHASYGEQRAAIEAAEALLEAKFPAGDISAIVSDDTGLSSVELEIRHKTRSPIGALLGGACGLLLGALGAWLAQVPPDPGLFAIRGAVIGAAIGTLAGALAGLGRWRDTILLPLNAFQNGRVVVGVVTHDGRIADAQRALARIAGGEVVVSTKGNVFADLRARASATEAL